MAYKTRVCSSSMLPSKPAISVAFDGTAPHLRAAARELADRLELPLVEIGVIAPNELRLMLTPDHLELLNDQSRAGRGLFVDFSSLDARQGSTSRAGLTRRQPLARAIGRDAVCVFDATAGLGHDAALLARMGYRVTAVERSPIIAALLADGVRRAMADDGLRAALGDRLAIISADARDVLRDPAAYNIARPDVVYIDPMFPPKRKESALAKKSIRMVREVVGEDKDALELLEIARQQCKRVVLKRPPYVEPLAPNPTASFGGKLVRYDLYARP